MACVLYCFFLGSASTRIEQVSFPDSDVNQFHPERPFSHRHRGLGEFPLRPPGDLRPRLKPKRTMASKRPSSKEPKAPEDADGDNRWMDLHHRFVSEAREAEPEVLWVGDSIIQRLVNSSIWERSFCQMHSLNFGIARDRTENVLWRLENGELEGLSPKIIVLHVGTNNHGDSADEVAEGLKSICNLVRDKQPQAYLVVTSLLPRGHQPNRLRERNLRVNGLVKEALKGNSRAQLVNLDAGFVQADGSISHHDLYDYLHLTQKGYDRAFEPVNDLLLQLLAELESDSVRTEAEGAAD